MSEGHDVGSLLDRLSALKCSLDAPYCEGGEGGRCAGADASIGSAAGASTGCPSTRASPFSTGNYSRGGGPAVLHEAEIARLGLPGFLTQVFAPDDTATSLSLAEHAVGDEGARYVAELLAGCPHLRRLSLARTGLTPAGLEHLGAVARAGPALEVIVLTENCLGPGRWPAEFYSGLSEAPALRDLHINRCEVTAAALQPLCDVICGTDMQGVSTGRPPLPLERLNVGYNALDGAALDQVVRLIRGTSRIRVLEVSSCNLGPKGGEVIASWIAKAPGSCLRRLLADRNHMELRGCRALLRAWQGGHGATLDYMDLQENGVPEAGCVELCRMVGQPLTQRLLFDGGRQVLLSWRVPQGRVVHGTWHGRQAINVFWHDGR